MIVNRLTVDGKDYFLPGSVTELREKIKKAIQAGGDYVNIPPLRSGPGIDILFSPGMPVVWSQIDVGGDPIAEADGAEVSESSIDDDTFDGL
ncbi:hypothetical protein ABH923_002940 [Leifsonia sp. EB41]|uniref:hypothetical protein n=1 Tax=Leifsonia sp. EB41 TaxID=3156260 RepID=UPI0035166383